MDHEASRNGRIIGNDVQNRRGNDGQNRRGNDGLNRKGNDGLNRKGNVHMNNGSDGAVGIRRIYHCDDRAEAILSAIYDAWADETPNDAIRIDIGGEEQLSLFAVHVDVEISYEKAEKVIAATQKRLGFRCWKMVEGALCAGTADKADALFRFLRYGFRVNRDISRELGVPEVMRVFELNRKSRNEAHLLTGFVRFDKLPDGVFFSKIRPVNDTLPLIADHFAERFNTQAFVIYDELRGRAVVSAPGMKWYFVEGELLPEMTAPGLWDEYRDLWKAFFDGVTIRERNNPVCQRTHCPLHFRAVMTEFIS